MKERVVPEQEVSDASDDLVRLAAALNAEIALLKADFQNASDAADAYCAEIATLRASSADFEKEAKRYRGELDIARAEIAALTEQRDRVVTAARDVYDWLKRNGMAHSAHGRYLGDTLADLDAGAAAETVRSLPETP